MRIKDVRPFPVKDQWWTNKEELLLYKVVCPGDGCHLFKVWHPVLGIVDSSWVGPLSNTWTYLWFSGVISGDYFKGLDPLRVGDAYVTAQEQVFFIAAVDRVKEWVTIISDEVIALGGDVRLQKLLAGPVNPADEPPSAYERILTNESIPET